MLLIGVQRCLIVSSEQFDITLGWPYIMVAVSARDLVNMHVVSVDSTKYTVFDIFSVMALPVCSSYALIIPCESKKQDTLLFNHQHCKFTVQSSGERILKSVNIW